MEEGEKLLPEVINLDAIRRCSLPAGKAPGRKGPPARFRRGMALLREGAYIYQLPVAWIREAIFLGSLRAVHLGVELWLLEGLTRQRTVRLSCVQMATTMACDRQTVTRALGMLERA
jgi:hypothetical protein